MRSIPPISVLPLVWLALAAGCSGGGSTTTYSQTMAKLAGDGQSVAAGTAVATRPSVKITDQNGAAASGVSVTFSVVSGGGSITGASATTGSDGVATVGSWTLGATAGANTLTATTSRVTGGSVTVTFTAMTKQAGDAETATVSTAVTVAPAVKLVDVSGNPVGRWDSRTLNLVVNGGTATVDFGGLFTFPNTPSGLHFVETLILSGTSIGTPPIGAPITYNVIMDAIPS